MLDYIRDVREFDSARRDKQKHGNNRQERDTGNERKWQRAVNIVAQGI